LGNYLKAGVYEAVMRRWVGEYATETDDQEKTFNNLLKGKFGLTFPEIASDAKFMSVVTLDKAMGESRWRTLDSPNASK